jgi:hypothetical protein
MPEQKLAKAACMAPASSELAESAHPQRIAMGRELPPKTLVQNVRFLASIARPLMALCGSGFLVLTARCRRFT